MVPVEPGEEFADDVPVLDPEQAKRAWSPDRAVLCLASRSPLDEAACLLLAQLLEKHGVSARVQPFADVVSARSFKIDALDAPLVCLSYFGAVGSPAHRALSDPSPSPPHAQRAIPCRFLDARRTTKQSGGVANGGRSPARRHLACAGLGDLCRGSARRWRAGSEAAKAYRCRGTAVIGRAGLSAKPLLEIVGVGTVPASPPVAAAIGIRLSRTLMTALIVQQQSPSATTRGFRPGL